MKFCEALDVRPGVTAVIGSGGKSSLLRRLAEEVPGTAILCTTTHIRPFSEYPVLENQTSGRRWLPDESSVPVHPAKTASSPPRRCPWKCWQNWRTLCWRRLTVPGSCP